MKNQVTTIEQSRRLLELGVPAEKASMCWVKDPNGNKYILAAHDEYCYEVASLEPVPAYTVEDLLNMMPKIIEGNKGSYDITMTINDDKWMIYYNDCNTENSIGCNDMISLIALLCDRIEWLVSNGYKLEV